MLARGSCRCSLGYVCRVSNTRRTWCSCRLRTHTHICADPESSLTQRIENSSGIPLSRMFLSCVLLVEKQHVRQKNETKTLRPLANQDAAVSAKGCPASPFLYNSCFSSFFGAHTTFTVSRVRRRAACTTRVAVFRVYLVSRLVFRGTKRQDAES